MSQIIFCTSLSVLIKCKQTPLWYYGFLIHHNHVCKSKFTETGKLYVVYLCVLQPKSRESESSYSCQNSRFMLQYCVEHMIVRFLKFTAIITRFYNISMKLCTCVKNIWSREGAFVDLCEARIMINHASQTRWFAVCHIVKNSCTRLLHVLSFCDRNRKFIVSTFLLSCLFGHVSDSKNPTRQASPNQPCHHRLILVGFGHASSSSLNTNNLCCYRYFFCILFFGAKLLHSVIHSLEQNTFCDTSMNAKCFRITDLDRL